MSGMMMAAAAAGGVSGLDPDAAAFIARFAVEPDSTRKNAINQLFLSLKDSGIYNKLDSLYIAKQSQDTQSALLDWKRPNKSATLVGNANIDYTNGFNSIDAYSCYVNTNFTPSVDSINFTANRGGIGCLLTRRANGSTIFGSAHLPVAYNRISCALLGSDQYQAISINGDVGSLDLMTTTGNNPLGLLQVNRTATNAAATYMDAVEVATSNIDSLSRTLSTFPIFLFAQNTAGAAEGLANASIGVFYVGDAFEDTEQENIRYLLDQYFNSF